jgi:undecaprenyl-diphosphatase
LRFFALQG